MKSKAHLFALLALGGCGTHQDANLNEASGRASTHRQLTEENSIERFPCAAKVPEKCKEKNPIKFSQAEKCLKFFESHVLAGGLILMATDKPKAIACIDLFDRALMGKTGEIGVRH